MDVFQTHTRIVSDYENYILSFLKISDPQIRAVVEKELSRGKLWPEPLLQFNPAFEVAGAIDKIVAEANLHPEIRDIFKGYKLYRHQVEAIQLGTAGKDFIVTSGTGSGKSLTYIGSIFHHVLSHPASKGVTAVVVYPMNALINSQTEEFRRYKANYETATGKDFPIIFGQFTGQEKEESRQQMRENPPHVLLTNYMMLELLLTRMRERSIRDGIYENLRFLVFDELHTYRGRQGADIAMLIRRIRSCCTQPVICIGTSATMISVGTPTSQREEVAQVATKVFGKPFTSEQVVNETLTRSFSFNGTIPSATELHQAISSGVNITGSVDQLKNHPVAIWLENKIALDMSGEVLVRGTPRRFADIVTNLATDSGHTASLCRDFLEQLLQWINTINEQLQEAGQVYTILPFKVHQFISQTGSVYTTLDQDENRAITLEPGVYKEDEEQKKPIFMNVFSRASGHAFVCVSRVGDQLEPRDFQENSEEDIEATDGYLIVGEEVWDPTEDSEMLPETWLRRTKGGLAPRKEKASFFPYKLYFDEFGNCSEKTPMKSWGWFMKAPLLFDPTAGVFFDTKTSEGTKLTKLGSEGRSTSTTITAFSILNQLSDAGFKQEDQKLLSFTDNRQDAALQSGHFNDFVQVVQLRAGIRKALAQAPNSSLTYNTLGEAVFKALGLPFLWFANTNDEPTLAAVRRNYEHCFQDYLLYRAVADLRRSWRVVLPNLEQCALLTVEYADIDEIVAEENFWKPAPLLGDLNHSDRKEFICTILDFFRLEYAIHSENYLTQSRIKENEKQFREKLRPPWTLDRNEELREPYHIRYEPLNRTAGLYSKSMGASSSLGKFIKQYVRQRGFDIDLKKDNYRTFILQLMAMLERADYLRSQTARSEENDEVPIYRLRLEKIIWKLGDGETVKADVVKQRAYKEQTPKPNRFFQALYQRDFARMKRLRGADHTGQLGTEDRIQREEEFRAGEISSLFCSPTMELGIDIRNLSVVHMRNVPPNPANYAQRSGRAGRSGQAALVFTYCSGYSPHDRHYFNEQPALVKGAVMAPKLDLCNRELLSSHLNALVASEMGLPGLDDVGGAKPSLMRLVTDDNNQMPLAPEVRSALEIAPGMFDRLKSAFKRAIRDFEGDLQKTGHTWYSDQWIEQNLSNVANDLDKALARWRHLYRAAQLLLSKATQRIGGGRLTGEELRKEQNFERQAIRQLSLLRNDLFGRSTELSEFYPYRYLASEGFLPGYNFTRLPIRVFLPTSDSSGEFVSRPRPIALREFGPLNIIYHNGRKYRVNQLIVQDAESVLEEAKISKKAGYFLTKDQKDLEICPFSGVSLGDNANKEHLHHLMELAESRAEEVDRISCEEEERISRGFDIRTYFSVDAANFERVRKAIARTSDSALLNLRYVPAARLVHVNYKWRSQRDGDGFPMGVISGDWRSSIPEEQNRREEFKLVKLWTSNLADALHIEPIEPLGLKHDGVVTLQHALKRAIEGVFQVEPNEIGVITVGDPEAPNILLYEAAEGSLGILSQFVENINVFHGVVEQAIRLCRYDDPQYKGPASYDDLLSYYNQRDHKIIDRHLIKEALEKLLICSVEIETNPAFKGYEDQYLTLLRGLDPNSTTERKFLDYLYQNGLRLPDAAQKRVDGVFCQPDFYYEPRFWVFCDGTPHDEPQVQESDEEQRQAIIAKGDEVWVYYYRDNLAEKIAARPDIFRKVR
jgi:superfamily II DNA or RNA helicase